jgi:hypothetical protein
MPPSAVPPDYLPLYAYLRDRFADAVVLTFAEIEDLLGFALPDPARLQAEWWTATDEPGAAPAPSRAWTQAKRTATPRLQARTVRFERLPV